MRHFYKFLLILSISLVSLNIFGQTALNNKEKKEILTENGVFWKISAIWERELAETGPVGELKKVELFSSLADLMASSGLADSIVFKKMYSFSAGYFSGKTWKGSSGDDVFWETLSGLWKLKKDALIWEFPDDGYLPGSIMFKEFKKDYFIIEGSVEFGSEAFKYFEYKVRYDKVK